MTETVIELDSVDITQDGSGYTLAFTLSNTGAEKLYEFVKLYIGDTYVGLKYLDLEAGDDATIEFTIDEATAQNEPTVYLTTNNRDDGVLLTESFSELQQDTESADEEQETEEAGEEGSDTQEDTDAEADETGDEHEESVDETQDSEQEETAEEPPEAEDSSQQKEDGESEEEQERDEEPATTEAGDESDQEDYVEKKEELLERLQDEYEDLKQRDASEEEHRSFVRRAIDALFGRDTAHDDTDDDEEEGGGEGQETENEVEGEHTEEQETEQDEQTLPSLQVRRMSTGILNLDDKMQGGFVEGTMNLVTGKTGTGKTAFCASFLKQGAREGEPGVYVTTEEREEDIKADIRSMFGWDFKDLEEKGLVKILSIKPIFPSKEIENINRLVRSYISNLLDQVMHAVDEIDAERVIIDSVSIIEMFIRDEYMSRVALASLLNKLRESDVTALLTGTVPETSEGLSGGGIIEFLVDTVILLEFVPVAEEHKRTLTIRKMRRTDHDVSIFPFDITPEGIKIYEIL